jgi:hypothetical protein
MELDTLIYVPTGEEMWIAKPEELREFLLVESSYRKHYGVRRSGQETVISAEDYLTQRGIVMEEQLCPKYVLEYLTAGQGKGGTPVKDVPVHQIFQGTLLEDCTNCDARKGNVPRIDLRVERLKKVIASLKCVQAGFAFGVPEDGRELWLELVARTVLEPWEG